ncbi:TonB-dependent receptor SusC, partial [termite gut metagenome]
PFRSERLENKTSATGNISKNDITEGSMSVEQGFYNALPGLRALDKSGIPGEGAFLNLRVINSFIGNSSPLIVINNMPVLSDLNDSYVINGYSNGIFSTLSPNDIQNITFLKGADAALYGSLGANGVILIETDNATHQETQVQFIGQYGVANNIATLPVMEPDKYKTYIGNIALTRYDDPADILKTFPFLRDDENYYYKFRYDNSTNWQDLIYRPALITDNVLKIKGGDAIAMYDFSLGYYNQNGTVKGTDMSRYHIRLNGNINVSKKVDLFASMSLVYMSRNLQDQGMIKETNPLLTALSKSPLFGPYSEDQYNNQLPEYAQVKDNEGEIYENDRVSNPLAVVNTTKMDMTVYDVLLNGGINYHFTPDWKITGMVGLAYNYNRTGVFVPGVTNKAIMPLSDGLANNTDKLGIKESFNLYFNVNSIWKKKFNYLHDVNASIGWQAITTRKEFDSGEGRNTASDFYQNLKDVSTTGRSFYGYIDMWNWMNAYAYLNYTYNSLLSAGINFSVDGASSTGPDATRFQLYPAVNAAWNIHNMPRLRDLRFLNQLKLRAEYTITGNSRFSSMVGQYYYRNQIYQQLSGIVRAGIPNTNIVPERTNSTNIGLDVSVLKNTIDLTVDLYRNKTSNIILDKASSPVFGATVSHRVAVNSFWNIG